ncbi:hypothetical protein NHJ6243_001994 [Beauveria neobassiana]
MAAKGGPPLGRRSTLSRAPSLRRKHGRPVSIEDVLESKDRIHRVSEASDPAMGSTAGEVSPEWYTYTGGDPRPEATNRGEDKPGQVTSEPSDTTRKPSSGEDLATPEEPKPTSGAPCDDQHVPKTDTAGASPATQTRDPSPTRPVAEQKSEDETHTSEAGRPPVLRFAETPQPRPHSLHSPPIHSRPIHSPPFHSPPFHSPTGQFAQPHPHGPMPMPQYIPIFPPQPPPPLPPMSPPVFGMPHSPPPPPDGQISRLEPRCLSGYELLAAGIAGDLESEPPVPAIYRRFNCLMQQILLDMSAELEQLEGKMQHLNQLDSNSRSYREGFLPASHRLEESNPNEVTTARKQLREHIRFKMNQYAAQVEVYKKMNNIRDARPEEVHEYRSFLAAHSPVVPDEMRFLNQTGDLMCLSDAPYYPDDDSASDHQPPARRRTPPLLEAPSVPNTSSSVSALDQAREYTAASAAPAPARPSNAVKRVRPLNPVKLRHMTVGICMAIVLPILSFPVIGGFVSRMTVVALVALGMAVVGVQAGAYDVLAGRATPVDGAVALGIYLGFMTIVAATFG